MGKNMISNQKSIRKLIWTILPAQIISILVTNLSSVIDGLLIGQKLEDLALTAYGVVSPFSMLINAIATVFSTGSLILCGKEFGKSQSDNPNKIFSITVITSFIVGCLISVLCFIFEGPILNLLGAKQEFYSLTKSYFRGILLGVPLLMILPIFLSFLQYGNDNIILIISASISALLKLLLDTAAIKKGNDVLFYIGLSTLLANAVSFLFIIIRYSINSKLVRFTLKNPQLKYIKSVVLFGIPSAAINVLYALRNIILNQAALKVGGTIAVDSISICATLGLLCALNNAMAVTVSIISSVFSSKYDRISISNLLKESFIINVGFNCFLFIISLFISKELAVFFGSPDPSITSKAICFYMFGWVTFATPANHFTVYKCLGRVWFVNIMLTLQCFVYSVLGIIILPLIFGLDGLWINYPLADILTVITFIIYIIIKNKSFPKSVSDTLCYEKSFGTENETLFIVKNIDEYDKFVDDFTNLLNKNNLDAKNYLKSFDYVVKQELLEAETEVVVYIYQDNLNIRIRNFNKNFNFAGSKNFSKAFKMNELSFNLKK